MDDFLQLLAEALEAEEPLTDETVLSNLEEWDSLGTLAVVSMVSDEFSVSLASEELAGASTVGDLRRLIRSKS